MLSRRFQNKRRSKRLQKKLHLGQFKEMGFNLRIFFKPETTEEEKEIFFDKFIEECIEANNLQLGGSCDYAFICKSKGTLTIDDRVNVCFYLTSHAKLFDRAEASPLVDAWYGPFED